MNVIFDGVSIVILNWFGLVEVDVYVVSYKVIDGLSGSLLISGMIVIFGGIKLGVIYSFFVVVKKGIGISLVVGVFFIVFGGILDVKKVEEEVKKKVDEEVKKKVDEEV